MRWPLSGNSRSRISSLTAPPWFGCTSLLRHRSSSDWIARRHMQRAFALVDDHPRSPAFHVADVALLRIVHRYAPRQPRLAVVRRQRRRLAQRRLGDGPAAIANDDVRARHATRMEP